MTTRETVGTDTPASRAMAVIVTLGRAPPLVPLLSVDIPPPWLTGATPASHFPGRTLGTLQKSSGKPDRA
ncbi:hypothetical protein GCM10010390_08500 [Streptomyces mordarskii]|uniref:Uncharacterized protein n=1 Tax=Streptomyces mordarskii TaxID=1226758 RepID=A0ABP3LVC1_9ACTN